MIKQIEYVEVEKSVPQIIEKKQVINVEKEIAVEIRVPEVHMQDVV